MSTDTEKTVVVFRKFKYTDEIIALFPNDKVGGFGNVSSYQHVGQHGAADYNGCMKKSVAATPEEFSGLKLELESLGYLLDVKKRHRLPKVKTVVEQNSSEVNSLDSL